MDKETNEKIVLMSRLLRV